MLVIVQLYKKPQCALALFVALAKASLPRAVPLWFQSRPMENPHEDSDRT